jgi:hypothetical protein
MRETIPQRLHARIAVASGLDSGAFANRSSLKTAIATGATAPQRAPVSFAARLRGDVQTRVPITGFRQSSSSRERRPRVRGESNSIPTGAVLPGLPIGNQPGAGGMT